MPLRPVTLVQIQSNCHFSTYIYHLGRICYDRLIGDAVTTPKTLTSLHQLDGWLEAHILLISSCANKQRTRWPSNQRDFDNRIILSCQDATVQNCNDAKQLSLPR